MKQMLQPKIKEIEEHPRSWKKTCPHRWCPI